MFLLNIQPRESNMQKEYTPQKENNSLENIQVNFLPNKKINLSLWLNSEIF
jgi:hypothetical protein